MGALGGQDRKNMKKIPTFGASWGHLGAVLGASWGRLGAWSAVLGRLGASWGRLEPSEKQSQNRSKNRCLSRSVFEAILVDLGKENGG